MSFVEDEPADTESDDDGCELCGQCGLLLTEDGLCADCADDLGNYDLDDYEELR